MATTYPLARDRLSVLTGALMLGLSLGRFVEAPVRPLATTVLGSRLGLDLSADAIMLVILAGLGVTAAESLVRSHPLARQGTIQQTTVFWIVPGLMMLGLAGWLRQTADIGLWTMGLIASAVAIPLALAAEFASVAPPGRERTLLEWGQMALIHLVAFLLLALIYEARTRTLASGTAVTLASTLLAGRLFWHRVRDGRRSLLYGATVGILLGQSTWVLNYWRLNSLQGGLSLFVLFYALAGLIQQFLDGRLERQVALEYAGISAGALLLINLVLG
jgi:hypothetical protein